MRCPFCRHADSRVVDSREADDGQPIRRRRSCPECGKRFTTVEEAVLAVVKRSGVTEPFSRDKIVGGVRKACQGRRSTRTRSRCSPSGSRRPSGPGGAAEIPSHEVGLAILGPLRELDEVAYLRFASVYRSFDSLDDFEREIADLRRRPAGRRRPLGLTAPATRHPPTGRTTAAAPPYSRTDRQHRICTPDLHAAVTDREARRPRRSRRRGRA